MTLFGWDASHYDAVPKGSTVVKEGFTFMTHKAGGDADDAELAAWWQAMLPVRGQVLLGAYSVLYPGNPSGRADAFLAQLDRRCPGWRNGPFILQVDCEEWSDNPATVPPKSDITAFCDRLRSKMPKLMPIVYAPEWVYADRLKGMPYPLWASRYVTGSGYASDLYPGDTSSRWDPYSGQTPAILQFTSKATIAGQTTCDANAYRGTIPELLALLSPGWAPATPPKETPVTISDADQTAIATKTLKLDGIIANAPGAGDIATNSEIALGTAAGRIYDLTQRLYNADLPGAVAALSAQVAELKTMVAALTPTPGAE